MNIEVVHQLAVYMTSKTSMELKMNIEVFHQLAVHMKSKTSMEL